MKNPWMKPAQKTVSLPDRDALLQERLSKSEEEAFKLRRALQNAVESVTTARAENERLRRIAGGVDKAAGIADANAAEQIRALKAQNARLRSALREIAEHEHCEYGSDCFALHEPYDRGYQVGVADGHRCAANIARAYLAKEPNETH